MMRRGRWRVVAGVLGAAVLALAGCRVGPAGPQESAASDLRPYYAQHLSWKGCQGLFQCTTLRVPRDYAHPKSGDLTLAVLRLPALDRQRRVGSLVLNPGGPGGSGIEFAQAAPTLLSQDLLRRFDIVGFDPRGVGQSDPVRCLTGPQLDQFLATDTTPDNAAELTRLETQSRQFAAACQRRSGALLPHVATESAARDMDILRAALGDPGLSYLGKSYGTYLGAYYAELFPRQVRALVLDGAVDPRVSPLDANLAQARGFETALRAFVADCLAGPTCPLHGDVAAGVGQIAALFSRADHQPLPVRTGDGRQLDEPLAQLGVLSALYEKQAWPLLRQALRAAFDGDGTLLLRLGDLLVGRRSDGSYTNQTEANTAINCLDQRWPRDVATYQAAANRAAHQAPLFGATVMWSSLPCAYWPVSAPGGQRALRAVGARPILVVGTTRDPATPYAWAQALARELASGVLLTRDGDGHTGYGMGNACVDRAVDRYLIDGTPPQNGTVCR